MMSTIFFDDSLMVPMVSTTCETMLPPRTATSDALFASWFAWRALSAFCFTVEVSSSIADAVSSSELACSSVRDDRSRLPAAISLDAVEIASVPWRTCATTPSKLVFMAFSAPSRRPVSSLESTTMCEDRSPEATVSATPTAALMGRVIERVMIHATKAPSSTARLPRRIMEARALLLSASASPAACAASSPSSATRLSSAPRTRFRLGAACWVRKAIASSVWPALRSSMTLLFSGAPAFRAASSSAISAVSLSVVIFFCRISLAAPYFLRASPIFASSACTSASVGATTTLVMARVMVRTLSLMVLVAAILTFLSVTMSCVRLLNCPMEYRPTSSTATSKPRTTANPIPSRVPILNCVSDMIAFVLRK